MNKKMTAGIIGLVLLLILGGIGIVFFSKKSSDSNSIALEANTIEIKNFDFFPKTLKVKPGQKIKVINHDIAGHSVTSKQAGLFDTGILGKDKISEITAPIASGNYDYSCLPHPEMKGVLIVE